MFKFQFSGESPLTTRDCYAGSHPAFLPGSIQIQFVDALYTNVGRGHALADHV